MTRPDLFMFEGSEVGSLQRIGADMVIRFSAAHVQRDGDGEMTQGHLSQVSLRVCMLAATDADWQTNEISMDEWVGALSQGTLEADSQRHKTLSLPFECQAPVRLTLHFQARGMFSVSGKSVSVQTSPESRFFESYAC